MEQECVHMIKGCKPDEILNPKTGRCVKKNGKIGKEIMKSQIPDVIDTFAALNIAATSSSRPNTPSPTGKILNPNTGNFISVNSTLGRDILTDEMHKSVLEGDIQSVIKLVKKGASLTKYADPVILAAKSGNLDMLKFVIEELYKLKKTPKNLKHVQDCIGVAYSKASGTSLKMVKYILSLDVKISVDDMRSGFDNACREGNIDIVKYLVSNKYAEDEETISGGIYSTISSGLKNPVLHYLISLNKVKKLPGLVLAVHLNNLDMIKFLVSNGADINERDGWNIISSAEKKNWDILKYFADNKGNVRARDDKILKMKHLPEDIRDYILKK